MNPIVRGGPFWTPITPQTGSFFHAESQLVDWQQRCRACELVEQTQRSVKDDLAAPNSRRKFHNRPPRYLPRDRARRACRRAHRNLHDAPSTRHDPKTPKASIAHVSASLVARRNARVSRERRRRRISRDHPARGWIGAANGRLPSGGGRFLLRFRLGDGRCLPGRRAEPRFDFGVARDESSPVHATKPCGVGRNIGRDRRFAIRVARRCDGIT